MAGREAVEAPIAALCFSVKKFQRTIGVAARIPRLRGGMDDRVSWTFVVYEFLDNEQFSNLDALLVQLAPAECFVPPDSVAKSGKPSIDGTKVRVLLDRRGCEVREARSTSYKGADLSKQLAMLLDDASLRARYTHELERPLGTSSVAALVAELKLADTRSSGGGDDDGSDGDNRGDGFGDGDARGTYELVPGTLGQFMRLDSAAAEAVTLLPDPSFPRTHGSLFQVLNRCRTKMGARLLERWLRQPLVDRAAIDARHDAVGVLKAAASLRSALQDGPLQQCPDLELLRTRMQRRGAAGLTDLYRLYNFTLSLPAFSEVIEGFAADAAADAEAAASNDDGSPSDKAAAEAVRGAALLVKRFATPLARLRGNFAQLVQLVDTVVDASQLPDLVINPSYSEELRDLRERIDAVRERVAELHEEARDGWCAGLGGSGSCLLEEDKLRGFMFRLTKANALQDVKEARPDIEVVSVLKNGLHFTTPELRAAGREHMELRREYGEEQAELVAKAVETAATYLPVVEAASALVAELDVLAGFAEAAAIAPAEYARPVMRDRGAGIMAVRDARHPCLEWQDGVTFIPNSYDMRRGRGGFAVVTGPNMGGKSTYIRTLGALAVMAQVGSFLPCAEAEMAVVDAVYARAGAGDAQQRGVSTFMAEMLEAGAILQDATADSLVVIDELGRGTSTYDGFGLAWGISEYLVRETRAFCLFATHFHEMTVLAEGRPAVQNLYVSAQVQAAVAVVIAVGGVGGGTG
ncbi:unnamed protein product, partial [Phaeothamnion confervicola]